MLFGCLWMNYYGVDKCKLEFMKHCCQNFPKLAQIALLILSISVVCFITVFRSPYFLRGFQASHYTGQKSSFPNNRGHVLGQPAVELRLRVDVVQVPQLGLGLLLAAGLVNSWKMFRN